MGTSSRAFCKDLGDMSGIPGKWQEISENHRHEPNQLRGVVIYASVSSYGGGLYLNL